MEKYTTDECYIIMPTKNKYHCVNCNADGEWDFTQETFPDRCPKCGAVIRGFLDDKYNKVPKPQSINDMAKAVLRDWLSS